MPRKKEKIIDDNFIMSPKVDFAFKLLFGDPKNIDLLKSLLNAILNVPNNFYAKYFNNKYNYVGHLFQERYGSEIINDDKYMLETSRYIHLNPVKANMVKKL